VTRICGKIENIRLDAISLMAFIHMNNNPLEMRGKNEGKGGVFK